MYYPLWTLLVSKLKWLNMENSIKILRKKAQNLKTVVKDTVTSR